MKYIALTLVFSILFVTTPFALASDEVVYEVEMLIKKGKDSKELDTTLTFKEDSFEVVPDKKSYQDQGKTFKFDEIKAADYSNAKKPLLSTGGSIATVALLGLVAIPFLFMKKKRHWLSVRTENEFAVIKLQKSNFRQVLAEFETRGVAINTVKEEDEKDKKDKDDEDSDDDDNGTMTFMR